MPEVFVGRQPIYTRELDVFGYELLFRDAADASRADFRDGDQATSHVILSAFLEIGAENVVGQRRAFLNLTRGFITGEYPLPVSADQVVLEVLEDVVPDDEVMAGLRLLKEQGFTIALDDYYHREDLSPLLDIADIVKIDCLQVGQENVAAEVERLRGRGVKLLAEKIESFEEFECYESLGFDYFQGYFLSRPRVVRGRRVPANRLGILRLLTMLHDPNVSISKVEELVRQDVTLCYKLLRHVNSAMYGLKRHIDDVRESIVILGLEHVRSLVSLVLLTGLDDKPHDLISISLLRAKMCELLAAAEGRPNTTVYFTTGLFSTLDAVMDAPMQSLLRELPLSDDVRLALLEKEGSLGEALRCVLAYEQGEWAGARYADLTAGGIKQAFLGAVAWANRVERELLTSRPS
jgi:EAL and modified HD-GYP domain-containing signal transduction protein